MLSRRQGSGLQFEPGIGKGAGTKRTSVQKEPAAEPHAVYPEPSVPPFLRQFERAGIDGRPALTKVMRERIETAGDAYGFPIPFRLQVCFFEFLSRKEGKVPNAVQVQLKHDMPLLFQFFRDFFVEIFDPVADLPRPERRYHAAFPLIRRIEDRRKRLRIFYGFERNFVCLPGIYTCFFFVQ